jgi:hypothetical protein
VEKKWYMRFIAVLMAVIVFVGTVGLTINAHYCSTQKTLQKSLFAADISCDHGSQSCAVDAAADDSTKACCVLHQMPQQANDCCTDFTQYVKLVTEFDLPNVKVVFNNFLALTIKLFEFIIPVAEENKTASYPEAPDDFGLFAGGTKFLIACSQLKLSDYLL